MKIKYPVIILKMETMFMLLISKDYMMNHLIQLG